MALSLCCLSAQIYATDPPAALPRVDRTKARMPTAADMMMPTEAKVKPVHVFVNRVVLVAFPDAPKSMLFATVCRFAAMIKAMRTQMISAVMAITSAILISVFLLCISEAVFCHEKIYKLLHEDRRLQGLFVRGRGHTKEAELERIHTTHVASEHGTLVVRLPKRFEMLGVKLNQEIVVVCDDKTNPLLWEIKISPAKVTSPEPAA